MAADDREPEREVANDGDADASGTDNADAPGQGEWDAYPLIVLVIVVTVLLTVFGLGPMLGATLLPGLVHH